MKYLSVCSGIEAASVAWKHLGWHPVGFSEIEPFPSAVLQHHYPDVVNYGDMNSFKEWKHERPELVVGGTPCQSFSIAGLRQGLSDPRGGLLLKYLEIIQHHKPRWFVWENVPGVLNSNRGRDFGTFLGGIQELGYGWAWRVLDTQWVRTHRFPRAIPQRRRRVFVIGCAGDWRSAAKVLFERESLCRDSTPSRKAGKGFTTCVAPSLTTYDPSRSPQSSEITNQVGAVVEAYNITFCDANGTRKDRPDGGCYINKTDASSTITQVAMSTHVLNTLPEVAQTSSTRHHKQPSCGRDGLVGNPIAVPLKDPRDLIPENNSTRKSNGVGKPSDPAFTLRSGIIPSAAICVHGTQDPCVSDIAFAQGRNNGAENAILLNLGVRRLIPIECERLQGFPDNYTQIPWRKKPPHQCPDGPRYKALGNSMSTNVMEWIGDRIAKVDAMLKN